MRRPDPAFPGSGSPRARVAEVTCGWTAPADPADVIRSVEIRAPSGLEEAVPAFWDGGSTWRARFRATEPGRWSWRAIARPEEVGAPDIDGWLDIGPDLGSGPPVVRGGIAVGDDRGSLVDADGAPFFWMADTAWNGPLRSTEVDWQEYLATRVQQGFTAVQVVTTQWLASPDGDALGRPAYADSAPIRIDPDFFRRLDARVDSAASAGLIVVPVLLWAAEWTRDARSLTNPGTVLGVADAVTLARYVVARWHAHAVAWILAGDGPYEGARSARWSEIGRAVFAGPHAPVTMHPSGRQWPVASLADEPWYDFIGYQSGHWGDDDSLAWLSSGPPATDWQTWKRPVINLEPPYEGIGDLALGGVFDARRVRRALYWSLLNAPTAGVTYGAHGVWGWDEGGAPSPAHEIFGDAPAWRSMLHAPGAQQIRHLRAVFDSLPWWRLVPDPGAVIEPSDPPPAAQPLVATTTGPSPRVTVAYLPDGGRLVLRLEAGPELTATRHDPVTGAVTPVDRTLGCASEDGFVTVTAETPAGRDWMLVIRA